MAVMGTARGRQRYDISFVASFRCDLACSFCMYSSGPDVQGELDLGVARDFISTIDLDCVNAFGLYGGEPSLFIPHNTAILEMLPPHVPAFVITNGTWSRDKFSTILFLNWAALYNLTVFVSGTAQHRRYQDRAVLEELASRGKVTLKDAATQFIPMGRLANWGQHCTMLCDVDQRPTRIALKPDGDVMFQNCDGSYPVVGRASEGFAVIRDRLAAASWRTGCPHYDGGYREK